MDALKEPAISHTFVGWNEDWEEDKWKTYGTMDKVKVSNRYKNLQFVLLDTVDVCYI